MHPDITTITASALMAGIITWACRADNPAARTSSRAPGFATNAGRWRAAAGRVP